MKKGMELPVNIIVIIAIAVLVMVAIAAFFVTGFWKPVDSINEVTAFSSGCENLRSIYQCKASNVNKVMLAGYSPSGTTNAKCSLGYLCGKRGASDAIQCAKLCGCLPVYGDITTGNSNVLDGTCSGLGGGPAIPASCGNNACEPGETHSNCAVDCP